MGGEVGKREGEATVTNKNPLGNVACYGNLRSLWKIMRPVFKFCCKQCWYGQRLQLKCSLLSSNGVNKVFKYLFNNFSTFLSDMSYLSASVSSHLPPETSPPGRDNTCHSQTCEQLLGPPVQQVKCNKSILAWMHMFLLCDIVTMLSFSTNLHKKALKYRFIWIVFFSHIKVSSNVHWQT